MANINRQDMIHTVREWLHSERHAGKKPTDEDIAAHFNIPLNVARHIHDEIQRHGS